MNTLIFDFLDSYADNPNPQYAVMLKGKWGCGKTHFIKQWKKRFGETANTDEKIMLKPIYISTYGMDSVNDIMTAIDIELNPFFYSKTGRFLQKMKSKINDLPDQMQKALRNLTEKTVEELIIIIAVR